MRMSSRFFSFVSLTLAIGFAVPAHATDAFHRRYSDIQAELAGLAKKFPARVQVFSIGTNDTGQPIQGIKVGTGPMHSLVVSTHHGNEYGATEVALAFANAVSEDPIPGQTVYVIPVLNVSGYDVRSREELGRDPNRDYLGPCGTDGPWHLRSTTALAAFIDHENIVASATLHTYGPIVLYPWGFSTHDLKTEYDDQYIALSNDAAQGTQNEVGNSAAALYPADGCFEDYAMWKHGIWSLLFEMGTSHSPSQDAIDTLIRENVPGLRRFLVNAPTARAEKHAFTGKCDTDKSGPRRVDE